MRAWSRQEYGGPEALRLDELPAAYAYVATGRKVGNVVVSLGT